MWCTEGPRIRLSGIAAREIDGTCRDNQPCQAVYAEASRDAPASRVGTPIGHSCEGHVLVEAPTMRCVSTGSAGGNCTGAWCVSPRGGDLSCATVASGHVLRWQRYWKNYPCPGDPRPR